MSDFIANRDVIEHKMLILHCIKIAKIPLSNLQLVRIMLENGFMNYFFLQQYLDELIKDSLLNTSSSDIDKHPYYIITAKGIKTLEMFEEYIPMGVKKRIDLALIKIRKEFRDISYINADYTPENQNTFEVHLNIREDEFTLINLNITVGSKNDARKICLNWKKKSQDLYTQILKLLLREDNTT